jgi:hypothetical protein
LLRRTIIASVLALVAALAFGASAWTQVSDQDGVSEIDAERTPEPTSFDVEDRAEDGIANSAQLSESWQQLLSHHAQVVQQREAVQENTWAHHQMVSEQLGPRAPKHTPRPMPTVKPLEP